MYTVLLRQELIHISYNASKIPDNKLTRKYFVGRVH